VRRDTDRKVNTKMHLFHPVIVSPYFQAVIWVIIPGVKHLKPRSVITTQCLLLSATPLPPPQQFACLIVSGAKP
jgi:hypothetical protein